jgi:hypothetical protein
MESDHQALTIHLTPLHHGDSVMRNSIHKSVAKFKPTEVSEFSQTFDYVMVFPMNGETQSEEARYCIGHMLAAQLEIFPYLSVQKDELLVLIRCPVRSL